MIDWTLLQHSVIGGSERVDQRVSHFLLSDRLLATLSCVLALLKWKVGDLQVQKGKWVVFRNIRSDNLFFCTNGLC